MFFYKVEGHMPKLSSFGRGKKFWPKKSLTSLLHAALQLYIFDHFVVRQIKNLTKISPTFFRFPFNFTLAICVARDDKK